MNIKNDGSRSSLYFCTGLNHIVDAPPKKSWLSKKTVNWELKNMDLLVTKTDKLSLEWLKEEVTNYAEKYDGDFSSVLIIVVDYFKDSMIQEKYILNRCLKGLKVKNKPDIVCVEFDERDYILAVEDEFNQRYSYKYLTKYYKRKLEEVHKHLLTPKAEKSGDPKTKGGRKYADSSLV